MTQIARSQHPTFTAPLSLGFVKQHPVLTYFALVFAISWGGPVLVVGPGGTVVMGAQFEKLGPVVYLFALAGPSVAGLLMTGLVEGKAGFRALWSRLLRWRVGARWYAVALLAAPLVMAAVQLPLSLFSPVFLPAIVATDDRVFLLLFALAAGLMFGIFEELGWTGFAVPRLRLRHSMLATGLMVGLVWGAWHFPVNWHPDTFSGVVPLAVLLASLLSWLPAFRVLLVWVYDRTGSLLVAMLMHASLTACMLLFAPPVLAGEYRLTSVLVGAAAWWLIVAAVAVANPGQLARAPHREPVAARG